jgi:hypothetical protein
MNSRQIKRTIAGVIGVPLFLVGIWLSYGIGKDIYDNVHYHVHSRTQAYIPIMAVLLCLACAVSVGAFLLVRFAMHS